MPRRGAVLSIFRRKAQPSVDEVTQAAPEPAPETAPEPETETEPTGVAAPATAAAPTDELTPVEDYLSRVLAGVDELPVYPQPLMETLGLASAEPVRAEVALPGFDNSAMDGYAVRAADCAKAADLAPITLPVVGENSAGRTGLLAMSPGTAVKVMTGAPVPTGADAVVPYEWTDRGVAKVQIRQAPAQGANIRRAGEDVALGDLVLGQGSVIGPRQLGLLAAVGRATILTRPRPRVVIISTGSELRDPGNGVGRDAIYDANSFLLAAAVRAAGAIAYRVGIVPDEPEAFRSALSDQLVRADLVVTSGGVSEGDYDVVKAALREEVAAGEMWFGKVAMQPGKPQGFGVVGEDSTPIFTLPGNPVSAYVSFQAFVLPALRKMMGLTPHARPTTTAALGVPLTKAAGKRQYVRALYEVNQGRPIVTPVGGHGSHLLGDLAVANALIVLGEKTTKVAVGENVQVLVLDEEF